jgi:hypothetical protein
MAVPAQAQVTESATLAGDGATSQPPVISYLSQGMTAADVAPLVYPDAFERAVQSLAPASPPPVYPDAFERAVQSLAPVSPPVISYLSHGMTAADALDPRSGLPLSAGIPVAGDPFIADVAETTYTVELGRSWYLVTDPAPARPDDRVDRFVVGDGTPAAPASTGDGVTLDWENGLTIGIGALAFALALGLGVAYMRRPRIAV